MSGGHFDYIQHQISDAASEVEILILNNDSTEETFWLPRGRQYPQSVIEVFKHTQKLLEDAAKYLNAVDYLVSDDYGVESFLEKIKEIADEH
jgi:hypothetical protein